MMYVSFLVRESVGFALDALRARPVRFLLSGFGVTIGVFCILSVWTIVDTIRSELSYTLNTFSNPYRLYVEKFPWKIQRPGSYSWWKYVKRPYASYEEYIYLNKLLHGAKGVAILTQALSTLSKYGSSTATSHLCGVSYAFGAMDQLIIDKGRYFSYIESEEGTDVAVIGHEIAEELGIMDSPVGKKIKLRGRWYTVIGVLEEEGEALFKSNKDQTIYVPFRSMLKVARIRGRRALGTQIIVDGWSGGSELDRLEGEIRRIIRGCRTLRPTEEDTFAVNRAEMLYDFVELVLGMLKLVGSVIASFSIIVGGFNIANVMFISVQERTFQIGLQKALGARRAFILWQFLCEALLLTVIGGIVGIGLVYLATIPLSIDVTLNVDNILWSVVICLAVGLLAGLFPAYRAARMRPIDALKDS